MNGDLKSEISNWFELMEIKALNSRFLKKIFQEFRVIPSTVKLILN